MIKLTDSRRRGKNHQRTLTEQPTADHTLRHHCTLWWYLTTQEQRLEVGCWQAQPWCHKAWTGDFLEQHVHTRAKEGEFSLTNDWARLDSVAFCLLFWKSFLLMHLLCNYAWMFNKMKSKEMEPAFFPWCDPCLLEILLDCYIFYHLDSCRVPGTLLWIWCD